MSPRKFNRIIVALLALLLLVGVWRIIQLMPPWNASPPNNGVTIHLPNGIAVAPGGDLPKSSEARSVKAAPAPGTLPTAITLQIAPDAATRTDLTAAVLNIAHLVSKGDNVERYLEYTPPGKFDPAILDRLQKDQTASAALMAKNPDTQKIFQDLYASMGRSWAALADQTPTFNAAGDEATFLFSLFDANGKAGPPEPRTFIRINGRWYAKPAGGN